MSLQYLSARFAQQIDDELMNAAGAFSLDQLMELAGLACAQALAKVYSKDNFARVLVRRGPGNQGGDGLVAARHLGMFGYKPTIYTPKPGSKEHYKRLKTQCDNMKIHMLPPSNKINSLRATLHSSDVILAPSLDFRSKAHPPAVRLFSVDIPSGWDVEKGNEAGVGLVPEVLISLTAPKEEGFTGRHFLGGLFIPKILEEKYGLNLAPYPGHDQIVELPAETSQRL